MTAKTWVLLILVGALVAVVIMRRPSDPMSLTLVGRETRRALERHHAKDLFDKHFMAIDEGNRPREIAMLSRRGVAKLDDASLETRASLIRGMYEGTDEVTCAAWARGTSTPAQLAKQIEPMDSATTHTWVDLNVQAMVAQIRSPGPVPVDNADANALYVDIANMLGPGDRARFIDVAQHRPSKGDADVCWLNRTIYSTILQMPEGLRPGALHVLATIESQ